MFDKVSRGEWCFLRVQTLTCSIYSMIIGVDPPKHQNQTLPAGIMQGIGKAYMCLYVYIPCSSKVKIENVFKYSSRTHKQTGVVL